MSEDPDRVSLAFIWDQNSPGFSRRSFLGTMAFASAAGFLAACGSSGSSKSSTTTVPSGPTPLSGPKQLNFYNWTEYIADDTIPNFQRKTGIKVTYDNYNSNDQLLAKIRAGGTGYDLIVPTDSTLLKMKKGGFLEKLDLANIPNVTNLDPEFRNTGFDPGNEYSIAWQWGTNGIGYDAKKITADVTDWDALRLPAVKQRSSMLDEADDSFAMALFALGKDPNTTNDADLDAAKEWLIETKKNVRAITSDYQDDLKSGALLMAAAYSGDVFQAQDTNKNLDYVIPSSGSLKWVDAMCIPKGAPHKRNAEEFMNYILDPKVGAALTNAISYASPNKAAEPFIDKEILDDPKIYPPPEVLSKLVFAKDRGEDELKISDRWSEVKNG
jgi:putrescine transport system substrate-binding protein